MTITQMNSNKILVGEKWLKFLEVNKSRLFFSPIRYMEIGKWIYVLVWSGYQYGQQHHDNKVPKLIQIVRSNQGSLIQPYINIERIIILIQSDKRKIENYFPFMHVCQIFQPSFFLTEVKNYLYYINIKKLVKKGNNKKDGKKMIKKQDVWLLIRKVTKCPIYLL